MQPFTLKLAENTHSCKFTVDGDFNDVNGVVGTVPNLIEGDVPAQASHSFDLRECVGEGGGRKNQGNE